MWRIYASSWLAYALFVGFASQLESLPGHAINWAAAARSAWLVLPPAVLLTAVWPLTSHLERRPLPQTVAVHIVCALGLSLFSNGLLLAATDVPLRPVARWVWPFLYGVMMYGVIAVIFHLVRASRAAQRQALAIEQARNLLTASELAALRSRLNPHFLFNTLHSIIALTRKDARAAEAALFRFSDMLRYVLDNEKNGSARVTLDEELCFVRDYLGLEALRLGARLNVRWEIDPAAGAHSLPPLTLQPLVENSVKHAFNPRSQPGHMVIRAALDQDQLSLSVSDDGPGADMATVRASQGLGIRTVERRLQLEFGQRAHFAVDTAPGQGFAVSLSLPVSSLEVAA